MMTIVIRAATRADYRGICRLFRQGDELHARAMPDEFRVARGPSRPKTYIHGLLSDPGTMVLLAERGGKVAGISVAYVTRIAGGPLVRKKSAVLDSIVVDAKHRRTGVGSALLRATEAWAKEKGLSDVRLNVFDSNEDALRFYAIHGYRPLTRRLIKKV